ncbi:MAG: T9SS type A sorting domain-containing protein [Bacteroidetes bacterium]|nr:T9SS type A sorting domain-containing protein [Bacteroidota bacterium]MCZ2133769.1 T9SS type A sorting domain-containing protein [Bacteroidota bacterium]
MKNSFSLLPITAVAVTFAASVFCSFAQTNYSKQKQPDFYEIQRAASEYWRGKIESAEKRENGEIEGGYNQYKRWEWFWEDRLYPSGELPQPDILLRESRKLEARKRKAESNLGITAEQKWHEIGPIVIPASGTGGAGRVNNVTILPDFPNLMWAATAGGGAWKSTDAGKTWRNTTDRLPTLGVTDIALVPANPNIVYLATGDGDGPGGYDQPIAYSAGVLKSVDGGETWQSTGLQYNTTAQRRIYRLLHHPEIANTLMAATDNGIFKTTDGGTTWTQKAAGAYRDMEYKPEEPNIMYSCGGNIVYRSTDGGETWKSLAASIPENIGRMAIAVTYANPEYIYIVTARRGSWDFGGFYRSTNSGETWQLTATAPNIIGRDLNGFDTDNQQGWYDLCVAASNNKSNTVYVGGINIWKSTNGGSTWTIASHWFGQAGTPYVHADIHGITAGYNDDEMYAATDGGVFKSVNQKTWVNLSNGMGIMQFYRISGSQQDAGTILGGAQDNGTSLLSADKWSEVNGGDGMNCLIDYLNPLNMFVSFQNGAIKRSVDGGQNFSGTINENITAENGSWVTPYIFHPTNPKILFAGYQNVWKTTNGGLQWSKLGDLPGGGATLSYIATAPSNPDIIIAGNASRIYKTEDGGISWEKMTSPSGSAIKHVAFHPNNPEKFWIVYSGYSQQKAFETSDGGKTFKDISYGLPAIPTNCIIYQPDSPDRLYAGTDLGVFTRDTNSKAWVQYGDGLPNVIVNWLDIYKAGKKLRAGTFGRGMWETDLSNCGAVQVSVSIFGKTDFCEGDSVILQANGNYPSYSWSDGGTSQKIVVKKSGSYQVVVADANGCKGGSEPVIVTVSQMRTPTITANKPFGICPDDSITLDAGLGFAQYHWSTGDTTRRITVKTPGMYVVTVSNSEGCSSVSAPLELKAFPPVVKVHLYKYRDTLGTIGARSYQWYKNGTPINGATKQIIVLTQNDAGSVFKVKITDDNGCTAFSGDITITAVGVTEQNVRNWEFSPNPADGDVRLSGHVSIAGTVLISIADAAGRAVKTLQIESPAGTFSQIIELSNMAAGAYIATVSTPDGSVRRLSVIRK